MVALPTWIHLIPNLHWHVTKEANPPEIFTRNPNHPASCHPPSVSVIMVRAVFRSVNPCLTYPRLLMIAASSVQCIRMFPTMSRHCCRCIQETFSQYDLRLDHGCYTGWEQKIKIYRVMSCFVPAPTSWWGLPCGPIVFCLRNIRQQAFLRLISRWIN